MARRNFGAPSPRETDDRILSLSGKDKIKIRILQPFVEEWRQYTLREDNKDDSDTVKFVVARPGDMLSKKGFRTTRRFAVNVWDYDSGSVKVLVAGKQIFDEFDAWRENGIDVMASDAMITKTGAGRNTTYSVVRLDTTPFEKQIADEDLHDLSAFDNPPSEEALLKILKELNIDYNSILLPCPTVPEANDTVMPFGKHKGKTLGDLLTDEPDYVEWLINNSEQNGRTGDDIYIALKILVTNGEYDPNMGEYYDTDVPDDEPTDEPEKVTEPAPKAETRPEAPDDAEDPTEAQDDAPEAPAETAEVDEDVVKSPAAFKKWLAANNFPSLESIEKDDDGEWNLELSDETFYTAGSRKDVLVKAYLALASKPTDVPKDESAAETPATNGNGSALDTDALRAKIKDEITSNSDKWSDFRKIIALFEKHTDPPKHDIDKLDRTELEAIAEEIFA